MFKKQFKDRRVVERHAEVGECKTKACPRLWKYDGILEL